METTFIDHFRHQKSLTHLKDEIKEDNVSLLAASVSYYLLLALVPAMTSIVLMYAWFSNPTSIAHNISALSRFLPPDAQQILQTQLTALASKASGTLGLSAIISLLFSIWSASKGNKSIVEAMNIIYGLKESRSFIKRTAISIWLTFLGAILGLVAMLVVIALPTITSFFNFGEMFALGDLIQTVSQLVGWVLLLGIFTFYLSCIYRFAPNRENKKLSWVNSGSIIASVIWAVTSLLFTWYASNFANFDKTYGSLGAIIVLMTWFYISSYIILIGGEINSELEHRS